nr:ATP-binding cassette domain-containing protein [Kroppenstedtia pulmonis]
MGVSTKEARQRATESLARVGLKERGEHLPWELSGGQQQRVAIARAIVNRPDILWMDEPTGALDRKTTEMILDLIEHLKCAEGISVVIVTHDPKVAERADRILYMDSGRLVQQRIPSQDINSFLCGEEER